GCCLCRSFRCHIPHSYSHICSRSHRCQCHLRGNDHPYDNKGCHAGQHSQVHKIGVVQPACPQDRSEAETHKRRYAHQSRILCVAHFHIETCPAVRCSGCRQREFLHTCRHRIWLPSRRYREIFRITERFRQHKQVQ